MKKKAIVVDLDGTLLNTNTFKDYILYVARQSLSSGNIFIFFSLSFWVISRKIRLISHSTMKKNIMKNTTAFFQDIRPNFINLLSERLNHRVWLEINNYRDMGYVSILSTAAPCEYADHVAKIYGFDGVISSPKSTTSNWRENVGLIKKQNTIKFLESQNIELCIFFTDHYDDLPLLRIEKERNILINPNDNTLLKIEAEGIVYDAL